jgi:RNA polymerase sigma-70 factor (ECF subfamily)
MARAAEALVRQRGVRARADGDEPDAALLRAIGSGHLGALGVLFDRHHDAVRQFVRRAAHGSADADDLVQETFLTVARVADGFDGRESALPFLFGIATRLLWRKRRTGARLRAMFTAFAAGPAPAPLDPEASMSRAEEGALLRDAITRLSDDRRMVLVMCEYGGLSGADAARALGIPCGTVWRRLHEARAELRAALGRR